MEIYFREVLFMITHSFMLCSISAACCSCAFTTLLNSFISISSFSPVIFYINNCEILSSGGLPCGGSGCGLSDTHELDRILEFAKVIAWL